MKKLIKLLIDRAYFHYQNKYYLLVKQRYLKEEKWFKTFEEAIEIPLLYFGGFEVVYDRYGSKITHKKEIWERFFITEHYIYLNHYFLLNLLGCQIKSLSVKSSFNFARLIETIAHEVAHCLTRDLYQWEKEEHGDLHQKITDELEEYLWSLSLVKEWERKMNKTTK